MSRIARVMMSRSVCADMVLLSDVVAGGMGVNSLRAVVHGRE